MALSAQLSANRAVEMTFGVQSANIVMMVAH
jgi:hypothetical protein